MLNLQNLLGQLNASNNPFNMILNMLPGNEQKQMFTSLANQPSDEKRAELIAKLCNQNGITKEQLQNAYKNLK